MIFLPNPSVADLAAFIHDRDTQNAALMAQARTVPSLPQVDPAWVRDWNAYMTRYAQAREVANDKIAASAGSPLDDIPAKTEYEALARAVKPYDASQSTGDFDDLTARLRRATQAPTGGRTPGRMSWSTVRAKLNAAGAVPSLAVVDRAGDDVVQSLQAFQAMNGLPSTGKLTPQTLAFLAAHGETEKRAATWRARFGGYGGRFSADPAPSFPHLAGEAGGIADLAKYVGTGAVFGLVAKTLGATLLGTAAAAAGGVALAAWAITRPHTWAA
jgi:Putative peptidoglycan binding domain